MATAALFTLTDIWLTKVQNGKEVEILRGVNATFPDSGITCLTGPSGSGKSSLLRLLNRLDDPSRGTVAFRGQDVRQWDPIDLRRRVGMVLQTPVMLPGTVRENLEAGLRLRGGRLSDPAGWLARVGLPADVLERNARDLSGGEKQRVALARTLITQPEVLLLDEVTASLDPETAREIEALIVSAGIPAIWISHDIAQVERVGTRVFRLEAGELQEGGVSV